VVLAGVGAAMIAAGVGRCGRDRRLGELGGGLFAKSSWALRGGRTPQRV